jgi:uncharacterized membrane protein YhhN
VRRSWLLTLGLAFGGAGDVAMFLRQRFPAALLVGMALFFVGHCCYAAAFFRERAFRLGRALGAGAFVAFALVASLLLLPRLGVLAAPVAVYAASLTAMTALAALRRSPRPMVFAGAALFFFSDVLIGARLAAVGVPTPMLILILPLYYLGQYWIAEGWVRDAIEANGAAPLGRRQRGYARSSPRGPAP